MRKGIYAENGVSLSKSTLKVGDEVKLIYDGLLKTSGASEMKAHTGYDENWQDAEILDMSLLNNAFVARMTLKRSGAFHCAFVDPIGNWDNNSGGNYSFKVNEPKEKKKIERKATKSRVKKI